MTWLETEVPDEWGVGVSVFIATVVIITWSCLDADYPRYLFTFMWMSAWAFFLNIYSLVSLIIDIRAALPEDASFSQALFLAVGFVNMFITAFLTIATMYSYDVAKRYPPINNNTSPVRSYGSPQQV